MFTINCKGKILMLDRPMVMGIINITPDSFFKGHLQAGIGEVEAIAQRMVEDGVHILDIGGQSTRPGSKRVAVKDELERVIPVIQQLSLKFPETILSIDTYYSEVAKEAINAGASIVNDISAGEMDEQMMDVVAGLRVPYVCTHMQGQPETMQNDPRYDDVLTDVMHYLAHKVHDCRNAGIKDVVIDPGFGFGKTLDQNFRLLHNLNFFKFINCPILVGMSRKGMVYKTTGTSPADALNGTTALNMVALMQGANILRVHDVKEAVQCIQLWEKLAAQGAEA